MKKIYLLSFVCLLFAVACKKGDSNDNNNSNNYYFTADLNGVTTEFKSRLLADTAITGKGFSISAYKDSNSVDNIWFDLDGFTPGTYKEASYDVTFGYFIAGPKAHLNVNDDAVVTITSKTNTSVQGTFSGTAEYQERQWVGNDFKWVTTSTFKITNGKFNVKISQQ